MMFLLIRKDKWVRKLDYMAFIEGVYARLGLDLRYYKRPQMERRILSLMRRRGFMDYGRFFEAMLRDEGLRQAFIDRVTINVSEFFRNSNRWDTLVDRVILPLKDQTRIHIWSSACSTGEEPYSLAMLLDHLGLFDKSMIVATDIDHQALEKARRGIYSEEALKKVPALYREKYFIKHEDGYRIVPRLQTNIHFDWFDLLRSTYPSHTYDLILNRNVVIYFTDEGKEHLYHGLAQALKPGGYLFVGSTEQIFTPEQYGLSFAAPFLYRKTM